MDSEKDRFRLTVKEKLSIIVCTLNGRIVLTDLLQSIYVQEIPCESLDIIVIDDASTDDSQEFIKSEHPSVRYFYNSLRRGPAWCKNEGLRHVRYEWILFLDNDIVLREDFLSKLLTRASESQADFYQPKICFHNKPDFINSAGGVSNEWGYGWDRGIYEKDENQYDRHEDIFFASSAALLTKKSIIERVGGFDTSYFYLSEDYDLCMRILLQGGRGLFVPEARCFHRFSYTMGRNSLRVKYLAERNRMLTILKNYHLKTLLYLAPRLLLIKTKKAKDYFQSTQENYFKKICVMAFSWLWIIFNIFPLLKKRVRIQQKRTISDEELFSYMGKYRKVIPSLNEKQMYENSNCA